VNLSKGYLLFLSAVLTILAVAMVLPFLQYFLIAVLLAFVLYPGHRKLAPEIGPKTSAFLLIIMATVALIIPFVIMVVAIAGDAMRLLEELQEGEVGFGPVETWIEDVTGEEVDIAAIASDAAQDVAEIAVGEVPGVVDALTHMLVGLGLALFLLFFFLKDGERLVGWVREITPLPEDVQDSLYENVSDITAAVLLGHVVVAIIQGSIAGIGLFVVGIPNALFWTFMMIILALLPIIGAFLVWGPASFYLFTLGDVGPAIALFVYGAIVVSVTDEFIRPLIVDRKAEINPSIIILGVIGGMYFLGFMGLFFGPVILGALKVTLEVLNEHYEELDEAEGMAD